MRNVTKGMRTSVIENRITKFVLPIFGDPEAVRGGKGKPKLRGKNWQRKLEAKERSPWGKSLTTPVLNSSLKAASDWVEKNLLYYRCIILSNRQTVTLKSLSCVLTRQLLSRSDFILIYIREPSKKKPGNHFGCQKKRYFKIHRDIFV